MASLILMYLTQLLPETTANTGDFSVPVDGKADLLWQNSVSAECRVWLMNGIVKIGEQTIRNASGSPKIVPSGYRLVGVGRFDPSAPTRVGILFQHDPTSVLRVWHMTTSDPTVFASEVVFSTVPNPTSWRARAVGDFNADGKSDIAFDNETLLMKGVWLLNGTTLDQAAVVASGINANWRITAAGDMGAPGSEGDGTSRDNKDDIILTYYNPAQNVAPRYVGIWYMNGTTIASSKVVSVGANPMYNAHPDWRFLATGNFDQDTGGKQDLWLRMENLGVNGAWYMNGYQFEASAYSTFPEPDPANKLYSQDWTQSTWRHPDVFPRISATATSNPLKITLSYAIKASGGSGLTIRRRVVGTTSWINLTPDSESGTVDSNIQSGVRYEYEVTRTGTSPLTFGYYPARVISGVNLPNPQQVGRGKVILVVEGNIYSGIQTSLNTYIADLVADGWTVVTKIDAPRHHDGWESCTSLYRSPAAADTANATGKTAIQSFINQHSDAKGVVLIGHVPVPFSGAYQWDGHDDHAGPWAADMWYGHAPSDANWPNGTAQYTCRRFIHTAHGPGDGKYDQGYVPVDANTVPTVRMFVGRIDFARLWAWGCGGTLVQPPPSSSELSCEIELLNRYFTKNHAYRTQTVSYPSKGIVWGDFTGFTEQNQHNNGGVDSFVFENAFRNLTSLYGLGNDRIWIGDAYHQKSESYQWGFLAGDGQPNIIGEGKPGGFSTFLEHTTAQLKADEFNDAKVAFYVLLGSYFGDHYVWDNFMRATLATANHGLAAVWVSPNPFPYPTHWQFHGMATGDCLGDAMLKTIRDGVARQPGFPSIGTGDSEIWISIIGDPTLRLMN